MKKLFPLSPSFKYSLTISALAVGMIGFCASSARAENKKVIDILPAVSAADGVQSSIPKDTTHAIIRLTPDKSEMIRLDKPAGSIIVGNPAHINVIADSSTTLVIIPRTPGATHFTVLGKTGEIVMQRQVIVASPKEDYIRIRKTCAEDAEDCEKTSVFYCPDMCHEIELNKTIKSKKANNNSTGAASDQNANNSGSSATPPPEPTEPPP